jgi:ankyrin repeat protein
MSCEVCIQQPARFVEEHSNRRLCGAACQLIGDPFDNLQADAVRLIMLKMTPNELAKMCIASKRINAMSKDVHFRRNYAIRWNDRWTQTLVRWLTHRRDALVARWLPLLLQLGHWDPTEGGNVVLTNACVYNNASVVAMLIADDRVNPAIWGNSPIRSAVRNRSSAIVSMLLRDDRVDPTADGQFCLRYASGNGFEEIVKMLIEDGRVDPADMNYVALQLAAISGQDNVVSLLLQYLTDIPEEVLNAAFWSAAKNGRLRVIEVLLPLVDPTSSNNMALSEAAKNGQMEVFQRLLQVDAVRQRFNAHVYDFFIGIVREDQVVMLGIFLRDPRIDPTENNYQCINEAALHGATNVLKMLLEDDRLHSSYCYHLALNRAIGNGFVEIVTTLLNDPIGTVNFDQIITTAIRTRRWNIVENILEIAPSDVAQKTVDTAFFAALPNDLDKMMWLHRHANADPSVDHNVALKTLVNLGYWTVNVWNRLLDDDRVWQEDPDIINTLIKEVRKDHRDYHARIAALESYERKNVEGKRKHIKL